jgi:enoyl-CoA hydratase/carnithine racemase
MERLQIARDGNIATVTLNNPGKLNALDRAMWEGLGAAMSQLSADDTLRCIVLRGAGDDAFAAGADIAEFTAERADSAQAEKYGALIHAAMQSVAHCRHPVIAMIKGACIGGGLEIAAMCDMRICGESSRFGVPIKNLGLTMGYGELQGVLAVAGRAVTLEILLEGRVFDAREALAKRLVNRVVADSEVEREAYALAARIAAGAPLVARWHKQFIERLDPLPQVSTQEWNEGFACFDTEDYRIGVDAFLAKTKPQFKGR